VSEGTTAAGADGAACAEAAGGGHKTGGLRSAVTERSHPIDASEDSCGRRGKERQKQNAGK